MTEEGDTNAKRLILGERQDGPMYMRESKSIPGLFMTEQKIELGPGPSWAVPGDDEVPSSESTPREPRRSLKSVLLGIGALFGLGG